RAAKKTLRQIASESGLIASFLSQAERNLTGVSISSLVNIAKSLNVPLNALFDQPIQAHPDSHDGMRVRYTIEGQPLAYERLSSSFPANLINAVKMNIPVGYQSELISHHGSEFSYVLSGKIVYTIERSQYPLRAGDTVQFDATKTHCLANVG
ncbi:DNA-binding protein, partial [Pseudomonas protegens]|uniref:helix-turn-helix domain-containing protein n=1 Tax=Pseudomonas protegens TaxID=380021 RepID=UPI000F49641E